MALVDDMKVTVSMKHDDLKITKTVEFEAGENARTVSDQLNEHIWELLGKLEVTNAPKDDN